MTADLVLTDQAALALIDEATRALNKVSTPDDADELLRKMRAVEEATRFARAADATAAAMTRIRLRVKRRLGELLGPAENRGPATVTRSDSSRSADREARRRARKLADVPERLFALYLAQERPDGLSEAGLLRDVTRLGKLSDEDRESAWTEASARADADGREVTIADLRAAVSARLRKSHPPAEPQAEQAEPTSRSQDTEPDCRLDAAVAQDGSATPEEPAADAVPWTRPHLHERVSKAWRILCDRGPEIDFSPSEARRSLPELRETKRVVDGMVKQAETAAREALTEQGCAETEATAQLGIEGAGR